MRTAAQEGNELGRWDFLGLFVEEMDYRGGMQEDVDGVLESARGG